MLEEIVDIIFASKFTEPMLKYLEELYPEFMNGFIKLYPDVSIRPKMHLIVHYPSIIRKNGALKNYSVLSYERMNGIVKKPSHTMNNYRNTSKTLAFKRQCGALHSLISRALLMDNVVYGQLYETPIGDLPEKCKRILTLEGKPFLLTAKKVKINNYEYRQGCFVVTKVIDPPSYLEFGEIQGIICDGNESRLVLILYSTCEFDKKSYCYVAMKNERDWRSVIDNQVFNL